MTNYAKWTLGLVVLMLCVSIIVIWDIQGRFFESKEITIEEAAYQIETLYSGKVESFEHKDNVFYLSLKRQENMYDIQFDPNTGKVIHFSKVIDASGNPSSTNIKSVEEIRTLLSSQYIGTILSITLQKIEKVPQYIVEITDKEIVKILVVNAESGVVVSEVAKEHAPANPTVTSISSEDAKQIALSQLNGTINYVVFEESGDGGFYLVEVSDVKQTAVYQIHAISGKVLSVTRQQIPINNENDDDDEEDDLEDDNSSNDDDTDDEKDDSDDDIDDEKDVDD